MLEGFQLGDCGQKILITGYCPGRAYLLPALQTTELLYSEICNEICIDFVRGRSSFFLLSCLESPTCFCLHPLPYKTPTNVLQQALEPALVFTSLTKTRTAETVWYRQSFVGIVSTGENQSTRRETSPTSATLCTTDPTLTGLGLCPSFRGEILATDLDCQGTAPSLFLRMFLVSATGDNIRSSEHRS